ncbi:hypothetical protein JTB14_020347 [Gonioctena quinquepunctata]|nr:hypothetical protein JTB14_020347 [Gonioctena quinquepunctata]
MTPEISDGEIMIEEKAKSSMATSYKNREIENNTSETDNYYQNNEEKLNELMNKMREEVTQHAEIHLNHIAAFNDEIEETNKNIIRDMCRRESTNYTRNTIRKRVKGVGPWRRTLPAPETTGESIQRIQQPSKKSRQTQSYNVETSNRFGAIEPDSEPENDLEEEHVKEGDVFEEHSQEIARTIMNKNKKSIPQPVGNADKKAPPIVVQGRAQITKEWQKFLKNNLKGNIYWNTNRDHLDLYRQLRRSRGNEKSPPSKGNRGAKYVPAPTPTKKAWNNQNQNQSLKNTQQPRREERRIQPTQGSPSVPEFRPQVVSGVTGGVSENSGPSFEDITNRFKKLNSIIDLPKMIKRLDSLIDDITNARGEGEQFAALARYYGALGSGNP